MAPETNQPFLPFALPEIGEAEIAAVADTLRSGWVTTGPRTKEFEERFAAYVGARHAIAVNSATAGLHLAMEAVGTGPGDIVITTPNTFTATAEVVRYLGADIELADIDFATMNISPGAIERLLEHLKTSDPAKFARVKAIVPVHFSGRACDMAAIEKIASKYGLSIIEDAAHALPTDSDGRMIGTIGRITVFSFYATKTITTGEGGMVVTDDDAMAARMKVMRLHGISRDVWDRYSSSRPAWHYEVVAPGFKYNLTDIASAIGLGQLARCDEMAAKRRAIAMAYISAFRDDPRVVLPSESTNGDRHAWQLFVIRLTGVDRDAFISAMTTAGVGTSVHFIPLHLHPYWRDRYGWSVGDFPVAFDSFTRSVSLPIYSRMNDAEVHRVIESVHKALDQAVAVRPAPDVDGDGQR